MTLNPIVHIDPIWTLLVPAIFYLTSGMIFGAAKPVPVNPLNLKEYKRDNLLISLAGPLSNLLLAVLFAFGLKFYSLMSYDSVVGYFMGRSVIDYPVAALLDLGIRLNVTLAVFNMIPVPPLDGSHVLEGILPDKYSDLMEKYRQAGLVIFMLLIFTGLFRYIGYPIALIYGTILGIFL
jgi:Zn-dependent protease